MKRVFSALGVICLVSVLGYSSLWAYSLYYFNQKVAAFYERAPSRGIEFLGSKPTLSGFPGVPIVTYNGGIKTNAITVLFPQGRLQGFPFPGQILHMSFPQGLSIDGPGLSPLLNFTKVNGDIIFPQHWPKNTDRSAISHWQKKNGTLKIPAFTLEKEALIVTGTATGAVDQNLQPTLTLETTLRGHEAFLQSLSADALEPLMMATMRTVLGSLSRQDPVSGEDIVPLMISVQDRRLSVGPLQVARLPEIVWGTHSAPALHQ